MTENRRPSAPWLALAVLALGLFITLLDLTIVNVAIPSIIDDLHASLDQILWVLNGYSLMYAVLLITPGRLGDIFGPRNMFAAGIVVFTIASAFSGLAQDPTQLILARGAQGFGAAILAPQGLPIMTTLFPAERRGGVFAIYGALSGLAVLLGPVLGGFIVTHFGWRWIFYVNLPLGVVTLVLVFLFVLALQGSELHPDAPGLAGDGFRHRGCVPPTNPVLPVGARAERVRRRPGDRPATAGDDAAVGCRRNAGRSLREVHPDRRPHPLRVGNGVHRLDGAGHVQPLELRPRAGDRR